MIFEIIDKDLAGRIGKLITKRGVIETPAFFPVINPQKEIISIKHLKEKFKLKALITNAYILSKQLAHAGLPLRDIHEILEFDGIIMTDSGAYQILIYGDVPIDPIEIVKIQEKLNSDIAVILDIPTPGGATYEQAKETVNRTLENAVRSLQEVSRNDIIWVGPVQGGTYPDLVRYCARRIGKMNFQMHAIGGPTQLMENYRFDNLVELVVNAKIELPINKPVHLFGAGHPLILPLLVALGCDTFDSASYAIYARDERYMTPFGTRKLNELYTFPCECEVCRKYSVDEIKEMSREERIQKLAEHNLSVILREIENIKQAIHEGTLWELVELKAKAHPLLYQALVKLSKYKKYIERLDPILKSKVRGIFYTTNEGLTRPEILRHISRLKNMRFPGKKLLLLIADPNEKPYSRNPKIKEIISIVEEIAGDNKSIVHECVYCIPFGIIPLEIDEMYPLSQHEKACCKDIRAFNIIAKALHNLMRNNNYVSVIIYEEGENYLAGLAEKKLSKICNRFGIEAVIARNIEELKLALKREIGKFTCKESSHEKF